MSSTTDKVTLVGDGLGSKSTEDPTFKGVIDLPYTLTAGHAAGTFLAELANEKIVGSQCPDCSKVLVPAQDFCGACRGAAGEHLVVLPQTGSISGFTETKAGVLAMVRFDGADTDMVHKVLDASLDQLSIGARVRARFAAESTGWVTDIEGFVLDDAPEDAAGPQPLGDTGTEPIAELKYGMRLEYDHSYGPYYGRLFDELAQTRRILGSKCQKCKAVLVPPREMCDVCFVRTSEWVDVQDTGTLKAFSVIHLEFVGQTRTPPYVYAEIVLDGCNTRLIHEVGGIDAEEAPKVLRCGMKVKAKWRDDAAPTGTLEDIVYFEVVPE